MKTLAALALALTATLAVSSCGGDEDQMSRQEFVDNLTTTDDGLITENIASCMYDGLEDDPEAAEAVRGWAEGDPVPPALLDLATACLTDPPDTP